MKRSKYLKDLGRYAGGLCQVLAREAFFSKDVLIQCTPKARRRAGVQKNTAGLPRAEMQTLKVTRFNLFPKYRSCPTQFKSIWKVCSKAVENACRREWHKEETKSVN